MKYLLIALLALTLGLNAQSNKKYWDNKQVQMDISIKNGKPNGMAKFYHDNGQLYLEIKYKDGKVSSNEVELFSKDGKLLCINHYKNSYPDGEYKTFLFQNNMEVLFDGSYKDGEFTGVENVYYKDSTLRSHTSYKDGKKDGIEKKYNYKGKLILETLYKKDKKNGVQKGFTTNGKSEIAYKNDLLNGSSKTYYKNGKLENLTTYKDDKKNGASIEYNDDGTLAWEGTFKDDKLLK